MNPPHVSGTQSSEACPSCPVYLMRICAERRWWFSFFREPLSFAMCLLARLHGIHVPPQGLNAQSCRNCFRPMKMELGAKSPLFRFGSSILSPWFGRLRASIVTEDEKLEAKRIAQQASLEAKQ